MIKKLLTLLLLLSLLAGMTLSVGAAPQQEEEAAPEIRTVRISTIKSLLDLAGNCRIDSYSKNLRVLIEKDLDLSHSNFEPIPIFCGELDGQGHLISGVELTGHGSYQGFFRHLGEGSLVKNLNIRGTLSPDGSQEYIGGIVGSNAGTLDHCSFEGSLTARNKVGGIVGSNTLTGRIQNCRSSGTISAEHQIGGIAGENLGVITDCENKMEVNISSQDNTVQVTSITLDTLKGTEDPHTVTDVGGIAGTSSGVIRGCTNRGDVGYLHMGYNIGGIAGAHSGYLTDCKNYGTIRGRKEAGGIVGQFFPVTRIEFSEDTLQILERQLSGASSSLNRAAYNAQSNMGSIGEGIGYLQEDSSLAGEAVEQLLGGFADGDSDEMIAAQGALGDSLHSMYDTMGYMGDAVSQTAGQLAQDMKNVSNQLSAIGQTIQKAQETTGISLLDVSDEDTPEDYTGKISLCKNYGLVSGDINTGGIAGAIAFEAEDNPEDDVTVDGRHSLNAAGELRAVILSCENRGSITGKKINAGGIVGQATLGLIRDCVNTGSLDGEKVQYAGGIAGNSQGYIRSCHVKSQLTGDSYVGGIAGSAAIATDCLGMVLIEDVTERQGAVLGVRAECQDEEETEPIRNNFYMNLSKDPGGIDGVSYEGLAEPMSPTVFISQDNLPQAFQKTTLTFRYEDGKERELVLPAGSGLQHVSIPTLPDKDGFHGVWDGLQEYSGSRVYFDRVFTPLYEPEQITIRSPQSRASGRPVMLAEGTFPDKTQLNLTSLDLPQIPGHQPVEAWGLPGFSSQEETVLHFAYSPEMDPEYLTVLVQDPENQWREVPFTVNLSCLVFPVQPGDQAVAIGALQNYRPWIYLGAGLAGFAALLICLQIRHKKKKVR